jgi:hypothetical protein
VSLSDPQRNRSPKIGAIGAIGVATDELSSLIAEGAGRGEFRNDIPPAAIARALVSALVLGPTLADAAAADAPAADAAAANASYVDAIAALATRGLRPDGPSWRATG